jgi:hypothetical protein
MSISKIFEDNEKKNQRNFHYPSHSLANLTANTKTFNAANLLTSRTWNYSKQIPFSHLSPKHMLMVHFQHLFYHT